MFRLLARQPRLEAIGRHRASPLVTVTRSLRARSSLSIAPFFEETQENTSKWMWSAIVGGMAATAGVGLSLNQESGPETSWGSYQYTTDPVKVQKTVEDIIKVVGEDNVETEQDVTETYQKENWSYHTGVRPYAIVHPESTEEVQKILKLCNQARIPVIPYGGGTALEGHTVSRFKSIVIDFRERMHSVLELNKDDMDVRVQPGITWQELNQELEQHGQFFAVDPGPGATIGGMVNTGCSGTNAVRYGTMRQHVLNLKVVTPEGEVIYTAKRARKTSAGYDLTSLFVGSEGSLGIVTEATLRLHPIPEETAVAVVAFDGIGDASKVVREIVQRGIQVQCCEILDDWMMRAINESSSFNYRESPTLFIKFAGRQKQVEDDAAMTAKIAKRYNGNNFQWSTNDKEKKALWEARKICLWSAPILRELYCKEKGSKAFKRQLTPEEAGKLNTKVWITDVCVPISKLPQAIEDTKQDLENSSLLAPIVGHAGDGNYHVFLLMDSQNSDHLKEAQILSSRMITRAISLGGTCTGEHGVGVGKRAYLVDELGAPAIAMMSSLKKTLDPRGIMNPGKILEDKFAP